MTNFHERPKAWQDWARQTFFKGNETVVLDCYRKGESWAFDLEPWTVDEGLFIEDIVNQLISPEQETITVTASIKPFEGAMQLTWVEPDPSGVSANVYEWQGTQVWLCKFNQFAFGREEDDPPETIWFSVK